ncbi:hypothetical protein MNB_SV-9-278 [hydrothermal vent metagenome]|uniref:Uncharacterized protein n=1 Tax=hydrothermal vent metagenome TaxID=652676 RepID=A0A1W1CES3_9ZZZZ
MLPSALTSTNRTSRGKTETHLRWWVTLIMSMALSIGTWNPLGHHFINYISNVDNLLTGFTPFGILLMTAMWILAIKSIFQSLKITGVIFTVIVILAFVWGLQQYGIINIKDLTHIGWLATLGMGFLIWFGLNASILWKKVTGVYTTDDTDDN